ncbi:MAG TPA: hypothetical protein VFX03_11695, partial [Thermomicrobiales bacterium]|nr:hypothetical protein [Thermomicrobiales bacterium]
TRIAKANLDREGRYEGMRIREHGATREEQDATPTAAWGNPTSFQHTEESLLRLVMDAGYIKLFPMRPAHRPDYTFYLCLPATSERQRSDRRRRRQERQATKKAPASLDLASSSSLSAEPAEHARDPLASQAGEEPPRPAAG